MFAKLSSSLSFPRSKSTCTLLICQILTPWPPWLTRWDGVDILVNNAGRDSGRDPD